ncbi:MAG TPA: hypothetical protein PKE49_13210 [Leptospiraceae bacterium]|nr:hypothetical protein [Leptospirales bacterium]HMX57478.1 hypothetical protein [Leptospiraceae bacterium]HMY45167.1 hypothetical protein [Leptospiraceae bacterium]HMZ36424.1 hypothetical protein [Leptospiraceae bacterium]HNE22425.1 hypothetical protein [Leptospiraceae bacterium]
MDFEFYVDPDIGITHLEKHNVTPGEIQEFFAESRFLEHERYDASFEAIGRLTSGRYLHVAYRKKSRDLYFIITAYDLTDPDYKSMLDGLEE